MVHSTENGLFYCKCNMLADKNSKGNYKKKNVRLEMKAFLPLVTFLNFNLSLNILNEWGCFVTFYIQYLPK